MAALVSLRSLVILIAALTVHCGGEQRRAIRPLKPCPEIPTEQLRLWLRGDAGLETDEQRGVVTWLDQSPEHNDFAQPAVDKRPVWDVSRGRTIVRFLGAEAFLVNQTLTGAMDEFTAVVVVAPHDLNGASQYLHAGAWSFIRAGQGVVMAGALPAGQITTASLMKKFERQRYVFVGRGGTASLSLNGREIAGQASAPAGAWNGLRIGGTDPSNGLRGDVAELLIYRRALSPQELGRIDAYLRAKYWDLPGCVCPAGRGPHPERRQAAK